MVDDFRNEWHVWRSLDAVFRRGGADMTRLAGDALPEMRGSIAKLMELIPDTGCRQSELARDAGITKQAVGQRLNEMTELGYVTVQADPNDGRAQTIALTEHGRSVRRYTRTLIDAMEQEWAQEVGPADYAVFRSVIDRLALSSGFSPERR